MTKRILIIYTGGTIGMQRSPQGYAPVSGFKGLMQERFNYSQHAQLPEFDLTELSPLIDSANLQPSHWILIAGKIIESYSSYDGFIVLHGTDTMAYSASALSFMLQGLDKPVIFTGSQIPLSELRNDALDNLITSLLLAAFHPVNEVCIYFNGKLLRGNRSSKVKATGFDAFDSPNYPWLGQVGLNIELHSKLFIEKKQQSFYNPEFVGKAVTVLPIFPGLCADVANAICHASGVKGLIIRSYGVGNLPDQNRGLLDALHSASDQGCIIVNISQCLQAEVFQGQYACSSVLNEIGVVSGGDMTVEAAFSKLHFLLATEKKRSSIKQMLRDDLAGELDS